MLPTLDQLQVRTSDLTEMDVVQVTVGQSATVTLDALPDQEFAGVVRQVALQAEDFRGEVVYATDTPLRWGMTAWVEFELPWCPKALCDLRCLAASGQAKGQGAITLAAVALVQD